MGSKSRGRVSKTGRVGEGLAEYLKHYYVDSIFSVGVGCGFNEYHIKKNYPFCTITCADFTKNAIYRLKNVFHECDNFELFDLLKQPLTAPFSLLCRVDTDLTNEQWSDVFSRSRSQYILMVYCQLITPLRAYILWKDNIISTVALRRGTLAGYKRTRRTFESLWHGYYSVSDRPIIGGLQAVLLEKID